MSYSLPDPFERRKIENTHRIMQDVLFAADKFLKLELLMENQPTIQSARELISYSRMWDVEVTQCEKKGC